MEQGLGTTKRLKPNSFLINGEASAVPEDCRVNLAAIHSCVSGRRRLPIPGN
jgi:hypothetical protein